MRGYTDDWFKVSFRIFDSSRWWKESPETLKLLWFLMGEAQSPRNPEPGTVLISDLGLAGRTGLRPEVVTESIDRLSGEDATSRSSPETQGSRKTLQRVPGGVKFANFDLYHPGVTASAKVRAEIRHERAKKAAAARWGKRDGGGKDGSSER